jgi:hypothetical protein
VVVKNQDNQKEKKGLFKNKNSFVTSVFDAIFF